MDTGILIGFTLTMFLYGYACKRWGHNSERKAQLIKRRFPLIDLMAYRPKVRPQGRAPHWLHRHRKVRF